MASSKQMSAQRGRVVSGPAFVLPPRDRLFCAFSRASDARAAIMDVLGAAPAATDSVWIFQGHEGAEHLDPLLAAHSARVTVLRLAQRLLTADAAYNRALVDVVEAGGWVIAIHVEREAAPRLAAVLERHLGRLISIGEHWNFVAPDREAPADAHARGTPPR